MVADDPLALLEGMRSRHRKIALPGTGEAVCDSDRHKWPCHAHLLGAALDAVLKPHQPGRIIIFGALCKVHENYRHFSVTQNEADDVAACEACKATVYTSCSGCGAEIPITRCAVRNDITRELLGEAGHG